MLKKYIHILNHIIYNIFFSFNHILIIKYYVLFLSITIYLYQSMFQCITFCLFWIFLYKYFTLQIKLMIQCFSFSFISAKREKTRQYEAVKWKSNCLEPKLIMEVSVKNLLLFLGLYVVNFISEVRPHGRLIEPPSRSTMWR